MRYEMNRRQALLAMTGGLAVRARLRSQFTDNPFKLGVASGDPLPDGVVLWTRLATNPLEGGGMKREPVLVNWRVASDERMSRIVRKGTVTARPESAYCVHVDARGLEPSRWYWYQF